MIRKTAIDRFMPKVLVNDDGCWIWQAHTQKHGYGTFWTGRRREDGSPIQVLAHRWAYAHFRGPIPEGMNVCHTCDIPACVNPDHLFVGTQADNVRDCVEKGRRGRPVHYYKLSPEIHAEIRARYTGKRGEQTALGREYGVSQASIATIVGGQARTRCR